MAVTFWGGVVPGETMGHQATTEPLHEMFRNTPAARVCDWYDIPRIYGLEHQPNIYVWDHAIRRSGFIPVHDSRDCTFVKCYYNPTPEAAAIQRAFITRRA